MIPCQHSALSVLVLIPVTRVRVRGNRRQLKRASIRSRLVAL
jgi:hypothetical protein